MKITYHFLVAITVLLGCASTQPATGFREVPVETTKRLPVNTDSVSQTNQEQKKKLPGNLVISILLPFNITDGDYKMNASIADYYEGILVGLDSLKGMGLNVVVNVYDTKEDSATVKKITWKKELEESNVIIGPTFKSGHALLTNYVKKRKIALVSPFSNANMWTDSNHNSLYCSPDDKSYAIALAQTIKDKYPNANLLLVNDGSKEDKDFLWRFKVAAKDIDLSGWKDVALSDGVAKHLKTGIDEQNIIVAPTDNENKALKLLAQLNGVENNNILFAKDSWLGFKSTNYQTYQYWETNHLHILTPYFVDEYSPRVWAFKELYKNRFASLPSDFAYRGFDLILSIGQAYSKYPQEDLAQSIVKTQSNGLHNTLKFRFNGKAVENQSLNIIQFFGYRFITTK